MLTAEEQEKFEKKIVELENLRFELGRKLREMRDLNTFAASSYGSEACCGNMSKEEDGLQGRIDAIGRLISRLRSYLTGKKSLQLAPADVSRLAELDRFIAALQEERSAICGRLSSVQIVKSYVGL